MSAYYNEIDTFAAAWLRELIKCGHIADGVVDTRSIEDVLPNDLQGFTQCHFFAGIGVWSYALRKAGWSDDRPVWTASCPCQPFSAAGKGAGFADERHLWPALHHLMEQCRPDVVLGEQVASKDGLAWFDLVSTDLEGSDYASAAVDICAAGFGAPHIRQRLYWVAHTNSERLQGHERDGSSGAQGSSSGHSMQCGGLGGLGDTSNLGRQQARGCPTAPQCDGTTGNGGAFAREPSANPTNGFWRNADWLFCRDGKFRPVEPGTFPLAHGSAARMGRLRGYGNAINAETAVAFIQSYTSVKL